MTKDLDCMTSEELKAECLALIMQLTEDQCAQILDELKQKGLIKRAARHTAVAVS